jgi:hypothetical protein
MAERSIVGDLITFRGLVYAPLNEQGVVFLFGKVAHDLNMYVEEIKPGFPDCIARRFIGKGWERVRIEFEFRSSNFRTHGHDAGECDIIVCWEHDWADCPLEVIELSSEILELENPPIERPGAVDPTVQDIDLRIAAILSRAQAGAEIKGWYDSLYQKLRSSAPEVWAKAGEKYVSWYSPEKAFASIRLRKRSIRVECFSGEAALDGTTVSNSRFSPRWSKFTVKTDPDAERAGRVLGESLQRIREAIAKGEPTGYFSGGQGFGTKPESEPDDNDE